MHDRPALVISLVLLFALSLHAVVTGRTVSESTERLGPGMVRVLGGLGIAAVVFVYFTARTTNRIFLTFLLCGLLAYASYPFVTGRGRDNWGREQSPAKARAWGAVAAVMIVLCIAKLWTSAR